MSKYGVFLVRVFSYLDLIWSNIIWPGGNRSSIRVVGNGISLCQKVCIFVVEIWAFLLLKCYVYGIKMSVFQRVLQFRFLFSVTFRYAQCCWNLGVFIAKMLCIWNKNECVSTGFTVSISFFRYVPLRSTCILLLLFFNLFPHSLVMVSLVVVEVKVVTTRGT